MLVHAAPPGTCADHSTKSRAAGTQLKWKPALLGSRESRCRPAPRGNHRSSRRFNPPGRNQRSRTGSPCEYIQRPRRSSIHFTTTLGSHGRWALHEHTFLSMMTNVPPGSKHPQYLTANVIERLGRQVLEYLDGHRTVKARAAERKPASRAPHPIHTRSLPRACPTKRPSPTTVAPRSARLRAKPAFSATQVEHAAARQRRQALNDRPQPRIVRRQVGLEPVAEQRRIERRRPLHARAIMRPSPPGQLAMLPGPHRHRHPRKRTEHEPFDPVAKPLLDDIELEKGPERPERHVAGSEPPLATGQALASSVV